jgi:hypothetical protein
MDSWIGVPNKDAESRRAPVDGGAVEGSESLKRHEGFPQPFENISTSLLSLN